MSNIDSVDIRRLDMTLLLVFQELIRHRKVTTAAVRLGLQQSSVSHALRRLRDIFGDELFERRPNGVAPTKRALELSPVIDEAVALIRMAIAPAQPFDPANARGALRLSALDYHCALLVVPLIERLRDIAPGLDVSVRTLERQAALNALEAHEIDLAIGFHPRETAGFDRVRLYQETFTVVARDGHPSIGPELTLEHYVAADHVVVGQDGALRGVVDAVLARGRLARRVRAAVPYFFTALATVAASDLICTLPLGIASAYAGAFGLKLFPPPIGLRGFPVHATWHRRGANAPLRELALEQLRLCAGSIGQPHPTWPA